MLEIGVDRIEPVQAVNGKNRQHSEIGDEERPIEPTQLMDTGKGIVEHAARETVQPGGRDQERRYRMREKHSVTVRLTLPFYMDGGTAAATYAAAGGMKFLLPRRGIGLRPGFLVHRHRALIGAVEGHFHTPVFGTGRARARIVQRLILAK